MSSIQMPQDFDQIPCQYNHRSPILFYELNVNEENKVTLFCQECLTMQKLPQHAKPFDKAKGQMIQQKQLSLELGKLLVQKQVQDIQNLELEIDNFKTFILQQLEQSKYDIKLWRQQLELFYIEEKQLKIEIEMESLHLNQEEYKLKEHIRLEKKILHFNESFNQKINLKLSQFFYLEQLQQFKTILDKSINKSELNNLLKEQEEQKLKKTQLIQNFPNLHFLRGNFDHIEGKIKYHLLNWRTYLQNSIEINKFYYDMSDNSDFLASLFPNFYRSQFHLKSNRLTLEERNEMIKDEQVCRQLLENFQIYLFSSGLQLVGNKIVIQDQKQFSKFQNINNMYGIQRVISSLSVLNQRSIALLFVRFTKEVNFFYDETFIHYDLLQEEGNQDQQALKFENVKGYFVQKDIVDKQWVTYKLLTNQIINV